MRRADSIPTGVVTLLFSDIEGSTRLWEAEPEAMAVALRRHDDLMRRAIERCAGYVFKTVGDAFCASFSDPAAALAAGVAAQQALLGETWPTRDPLRVRMAMHSGECEERASDYFGPVVNRTARLETVGHGGQLLVSGTTAALLATALPPGVALSDLGSHQLKDLSEPERVFQVTAPSLPAEFPPLRSLDNPELLNNLPGFLSDFVGREHELAEVRPAGVGLSHGHPHRERGLGQEPARPAGSRRSSSTGGARASGWSNWPHWRTPRRSPQRWRRRWASGRGPSSRCWRRCSTR